MARHTCCCAALSMYETFSTRNSIFSTRNCTKYKCHAQQSGREGAIQEDEGQTGVSSCANQRAPNALDA